MTIRVCVIIDTGIVGGPGKGLFQLIGHLPPREVEITVCNFDRGAVRSRQFIEVARDRGIDLVLFKQRFKLDPAVLKQARELVADREFDLVQTHGYKANVIGRGLRRKAGLPWLCVMHGWTAEGWRMRVNNAIDRWLLKRADHVIAVSPPLFEVAKQLRGRRPCTQILNAIELPENVVPLPCGKGDCISLGVFGRMSPEKGHSLLLDALAAARDDMPPFRVLLAGDGQEEQRLRAQCRRLGLEDQVRFLGYQQEMTSLYEEIDLLVLPSLSEGLPNVALEAMSHGRPVLATRVGAVPEVIEDGGNGWLVAPGSASSLADKLRAISQRPTELARYGERARASLHPKFSPAERARKFLGVYEQMSVRPAENRSGGPATS